jgi:Protein of unknown function (DUF3618)
MSDKTQDAAAAAPKPSIDQLRAEIRQTRADLGETVQALAAKADVKARAKDQVGQARERALLQVDRVRQAAAPVPMVLVLAGLAAVAGVILLVRGSKR